MIKKYRAVAYDIRNEEKVVRGYFWDTREEAAASVEEVLHLAEQLTETPCYVRVEEVYVAEDFIQRRERFIEEHQIGRLEDFLPKPN